MSEVAAPAPRFGTRVADDHIWGYMDNGIFWAVPKQRMIEAGFIHPPFEFVMPNGIKRSIIYDPNDRPRK